MKSGEEKKFTVILPKHVRVIVEKHRERPAFVISSSPTEMLVLRELRQSSDIWEWVTLISHLEDMMNDRTHLAMGYLTHSTELWRQQGT